MRSSKEARKAYYGNGEVMIHVDRIIGYINVEVERAIEMRNNEVKVTLPMDFDIGNMSRDIAQACVYGTLIKELEKSDYTVGISFDVNEKTDRLNAVWLTVSWLNDNDRKYIKNMAKIIEKHTIY